MSHNTQLKDRINTQTLHLVLLSLVTAGIYPLMWVYRQVPTLESVTQQTVTSNAFLIWMSVCIGLALNFSSSGDENLEAIAGLLIIANAVLYIVLAFKMKAAIEVYATQQLGTDIKLNPILTFGLTIYYINYRINKLAEAPQTTTVSESAQ